MSGVHFMFGKSYYDQLDGVVMGSKNDSGIQTSVHSNKYNKKFTV